MNPRLRQLLALLLLLAGVLLWWRFGRGQPGALPQPWKMLAVVAICSLPPVYRRISAAVDRLRQPSPRALRFATLAVFVLATVFLVAAGFYQERELIPKIHDEYMHLLQVQTLSRGRLWMPPHPAADSFESFHIFVRPVYASIYFPGTALMYLPAAWLGLPYWALPALVAGAGAAMLFRVTAEMIDAVYAALAALLLLSLTQFRYLSLIVLSHSVMLLLGLTLIWAWLRWRRDRALAWAAAVGALGGWAAITRPVDALCYSIPVGVAMLWEMRRMPPKRIAATVGVILAAASPLLALQLALNVGVTGKLVETPYRRYCDLYTPQMTFGFHRFDPTVGPQTELPQRVRYYEKFTVPAAAEHRRDRIWQTWRDKRIPLIVRNALPTGALLVLLPAALLALRGPRWVFVGLGVLFIGFYACFAYLLRHYIVLLAPAVLVGALLGARAIVESFPRARAWTETLACAFIVIFALRAMPRAGRAPKDDPYDFPALIFDHRRLPSLVQTPALVLYRFDPNEVVRYQGSVTDPVHEEPVYNVGVAWPDDAAIVRAHERSAEQNAALFRYYADRQPARRVYLVDRLRAGEAGYRPQFLGTVTELATGAQ